MKGQLDTYGHRPAAKFPRRLFFLQAFPSVVLPMLSHEKALRGQFFIAVGVAAVMMIVQIVRWVYGIL